MQWVTTRRPHVDRCGTAWLVRRFIDPEASFTFIAPGGRVPVGAIGFDMPGAKYAHEGDACTFEVVLRAHALDRDPALAAVGALVADLDLRRMQKPESKLLDEILLGLAVMEADDAKLVEKAGVVFDALYAHESARHGRESA